MPTKDKSNLKWSSYKQTWTRKKADHDLLFAKHARRGVGVLIVDKCTFGSVSSGTNYPRKWQRRVGLRLYGDWLLWAATTSPLTGPWMNSFMHFTSCMHLCSLWKNKVFTGGDFNAKSPEWGNTRLDARGRVLCDWCASLDLVVVNSGQHSTFIRRNSKSYLT